MQEFDVAIIGGGLVGASLARALAGTGKSCVVLDQQPAAQLYSAALDNRGLALTYGSAKILMDLRIWPLLVKDAYPVQAVHVSERGSFGFTKLLAEQFKIPALGYVVSASSLGAALCQNLELLPDITVMRPIEISALAYDASSNSWDIIFPTAKINAKLLVAADGSNSFLRSRLNIPVTTKDYQQTAIVANIQLQKGTPNIAYERFNDLGVLALLPFGQQQVKCVWTIDNAKLDKLSQCSDQEFLAKTQAAFGYRLGKLMHVGQRHMFPVQQLQAARLYGEKADIG